MSGKSMNNYPFSSLPEANRNYIELSRHATNLTAVLVVTYAAFLIYALSKLFPALQQ